MDKPGTLHEIGPQYKKDDPFTARMRFHQSWYRARVLRVPYGVGPKLHNKTPYGSMLLPEDGRRGLNFLTPHIFKVAERRLARREGTIDPFRLRCNLLSSQPLCFNLFGLLVDDFELAAHLLQPLLPGEIQTVTRVEIEYAPEPANQYLNDRTAFDVYVEYTRPGGEKGFLGIETKLTEPFSTKVYDSPAYQRWTNDPASPWPPPSGERLKDIQTNQLWRDHLLSVALRLHPDSLFAAGYFLVISHPLDAACAQSISAYRRLLKPGEPSFLDVSLEQVVQLWSSALEQPAHRKWMDDFKLRYLDLSASEAEFTHPC